MKKLFVLCIVVLSLTSCDTDRHAVKEVKEKGEQPTENGH